MTTKQLIAEAKDRGFRFIERQGKQKEKAIMKKLTWKTGSPFDSAAMAGRIMGRACAKIIKDQPGYRRGQTMAIHKTTAGLGAYRLFTLVSGRWMDASLQDLPISI